MIDAQLLFNNIEQQDVGAVRAFPGMVASTVTPQASVAEALRMMERIRLDAILVTSRRTDPLSGVR